MQPQGQRHALFVDRISARAPCLFIYRTARKDKKELALAEVWATMVHHSNKVTSLMISCLHQTMLIHQIIQLKNQ